LFNMATSSIAGGGSGQTAPRVAEIFSLTWLMNGEAPVLHRSQIEGKTWPRFVSGRPDVARVLVHRALTVAKSASIKDLLPSFATVPIANV
jgi:hypothetical protein